MFGVVVLNALLLSARYYGMKKESLNALNAIQNVFIGIFGVEMVSLFVHGLIASLDFICSYSR